MNKILWWILFLGLIIKLGTFIYSQKEHFLEPFDSIHVGKVYSQSQYVIGNASKEGIGDDWLYAFAGYYYLFQGGDVSSVNFEHPPLGKYLIGLSILFFGNENVINIFYFTFLLFLTYKISRILNNNSLLALLSVTVLSYDPLFLDNLPRSMLDLPFTLFFIGGVYFFLKGLWKANNYYFSFIFWGMAFSTRFFPALVIIYAYMILTVLILQKKHIRQFIFASASVPLIYLIAHISFFVYHPSLIEFLRHKKWMLAWFTGTPVLTGNILRVIFTGMYLDSTKVLVREAHWVPVIPLVVILAITYFRKKMLKLKKYHNLAVVYGICVIYLIYLTVLTGGLQKFMMPIYPILIVLAVDHTSRLYSIITTWTKRIYGS